MLFAAVFGNFSNSLCSEVFRYKCTQNCTHINQTLVQNLMFCFCLFLLLFLRYNFFIISLVILRKFGPNFTIFIIIFYFNPFFQKQKTLSCWHIFQEYLLRILCNSMLKLLSQENLCKQETEK